MAVLLELSNVDKGFSGVQVLKKVSLSIKSGNVVALAGENGAGKSTLMKIIAGIYQRDSGVMRFKGVEVDYSNARQSIDAGIAIIHQELNLLGDLSVSDNIFLGREISNSFGKIEQAKMNEQSRHWLNKLKQDIDPQIRLGDLSIAQQQMVEIARALSMNAEVIIMDEPTDALTEVETKVLFEVIDELRKQGKGLVFISHRLGEFFKICDEVAILRDGEMVHQGRINDITEDELICHMVGRDLSDQYQYIKYVPGDICLELKYVSAQGISDISFSAYSGEVVGFGGLVGAGRTELAQAIYGANPISSGSIHLDGKHTLIKTPYDGVNAGIGYVTEDRKFEGLVQAHGLRRNMSLTGLFQFTNAIGMIDKKAEYSEISKYINAFSIKTHGIDAIVAQLSGGNQQKVSIAKSLIPEPRILILDEPTRGVDVGAKREIYNLINDLKSQGMCILLMTSDMPELLGISDRILVLSRGKLNGSFSRQDADQENIMRCSVG